MPAVEEVEPCLRVGGEGGIAGEPPFEFRTHRGIGSQHVPRDRLGDVRLHVLLALEDVVETAPGGDRVRRHGFEDMHGQAGQRLRDRHEQRSRQDQRGDLPPVARDGGALVAFHRRIGEIHFARMELPRGDLARFVDAGVLDAVHVQPRLHQRHPLHRDDVAGARGGDHRVRHHLVAQRHLPRLRRGLVVAGHRGAGHVRRRARVGVAEEVDLARLVGGPIVERDLLPAELPCARVGLRGQRLPFVGVPDGEGDRVEDGVAGRPHAFRVGAPGMRLDQDPDAVAEGEVAVREAGRVDAVDEARGRVVEIAEAGIELDRQRTLACQQRDDAVAQRAPGLAQRHVSGVHRFAGDRDVSDLASRRGVTGLVGAAGGLGGFVPPLVMGYIYGRTDSYAIGLWMLSITAALTLALTLTIVRRTARGQETH